MLAIYLVVFLQRQHLLIYNYIGLYLVCFGLVTLSVTVTILVITVCYLKRITVKYSNLEKTTVKFGFFLLLRNGINLLGQTAPALISASVTPQPTPPWPDGPPSHAAVTYISYTFLNIALIPLPFWFSFSSIPFVKDCGSGCVVVCQRKEGQVHS